MTPCRKKASGKSKALILGEKHLRILQVLREYSRLNAVMIFELTSFSRLTRCQEALQSLAGARPPYVNRVAYHPLHTAAGRAEYVYSLAQRGVEQLSDSLSGPVHNPRKPKLSGANLEHVLELNRFRRSVETACSERKDIELLGLIPEYQGKIGKENIPFRLVEEIVTSNTDYSKPFSFIPDMIFALGRGSSRALFFAEIDLGNELLKDLVKKVTIYDLFLKREGYQRYSEEFKYQFRGFRLLFIASSGRIRLLLKELKKTRLDLSFFWAADIGKIDHTDFFDRIWMLGDQEPGELFSIVE